MKNYGSILEGLKEKRLLESENERLLDFSDEMVGDIIGEEAEFMALSHEESLYESMLNEDEMINEASIVTFGGKTFPKDGWALVMSGGAGSGKGYTIENQVALDAKILDVDQMKSMFAKASAGGDGAIAQRTGGRKYDFKNSNDVSDLHVTIGDELGLDTKARDNFLDANVENPSGILPNVIFDITGKSKGKLMDIAKQCKSLGYKTSLIWVVTNREVAMMRNLLRARVVGEKLFHGIHNEVSKTLLEFLKSDDVSLYDEAWVVFSGIDRVKEISDEAEAELKKNAVVKLERKGKGFELSDELEKKIVEWLGPDEVDVKNPQVYKSFSEVNKELQKHMKTTEKKVGTLSGNKIKKVTKPEGYGELSFKK